MDELDRDVAGIGARTRAFAERDQAAAAREALGHLVAQQGRSLGLGLEERGVGARPLGERLTNQVGAHRRAHTATSMRACSRSHPCQSSMPSPVLALTSMCGTPGWTASRL